MLELEAEKKIDPVYAAREEEKEAPRANPIPATKSRHMVSTHEKKKKSQLAKIDEDL